MTSQSTKLPQNFEKKETRGRKRLLKRDDILDGALFIGLDNLTMKNLAEHLKVGTATLYQYFENRETLLMEAAEYSIKLLPFPDYKGQGWQQMALEYTKNVQKILKQHPSFIHSHPVTDYGYKIQKGRRKVILWSKNKWTEVNQIGSKEIPTGRFISGVTNGIKIVGLFIPWKFAHVSSGRKDRKHGRIISLLLKI